MLVTKYSAILAALACTAVAAPLNINLGAFSPALVVGDGEISFAGGAEGAEGATSLVSTLQGASTPGEGTAAKGQAIAPAQRAAVLSEPVYVPGPAEDDLPAQPPPSACAPINNVDDITGIVRYAGAPSAADPVSESVVVASPSCGDEPLASLVPHLALDVGHITATADEILGFAFGAAFTWTINGSSLLLDWAAPTLTKVLAGGSVFPTEYNVVAVNGPASNTTGNATDEWALLIIEDTTGFGLSHPIHLHGHDFWILAQDTGTYLPGMTALNTINPPRRDVATLPGNGYLAIAFQLDNPGAWLSCTATSRGTLRRACRCVSITAQERTILTDT